MQHALAFVALLALPAAVFGEEDEEKPARGFLMAPECMENCRCGDSHPSMNKKGHPFMECDYEVQGVSIKILMPDMEYGGAAHWTDIPKYLAPKVLPPWNKNSTMPLSLYAVKPGSVVLDVGAGYGVFTLLVAKAFPDVKVVAVEPVDWAAQLLEENAKRNGIADRVKVVRQPVTKDGRDVTFYQQMLWQSVSSIYSKANLFPKIHCDERTSRENPGTKTITLEQLIATSGFEGKVSFAQIDCIGCEHEIGDQVAELGVPYSMRCYASAANSNYSSREWEEIPSLTMFTDKEGEACLDLQDLGENRLLYNAADKGRPAEQAIIGLLSLADGNRTDAIAELSQALGAQPNMDMPTGGVKEQYVIIAEGLKSIARFFVASALEGGEGLPQDQQAAAEMFAQVAQSEKELLSLEADLDVLYEELPMLKDVLSGSMYRVGEIMAKTKGPEEAQEWFAQASELGHALAAARLDAFPHKDLVGTNGLHKGHAVRQLMTQVRLEALGIPMGLHQTLLGTDASGMFDECMRNSQIASVPRWEDVFQGKGETYEAMGAYRFRSWLHSALGCWLGQ